MQSKFFYLPDHTLKSSKVIPQNEPMTSDTFDQITDQQLAFISRIIRVSVVTGIVSAFTLVMVFSLTDETGTVDTQALLLMDHVEAPPQPPKIWTGEELKTMLRENDLWDIEVNDTIASVVINAFPANLESLPTADKKKIFLHALLPIALTANEEIDRERLRLFDILASSGALPGNFKLNDIPEGWKAILSEDDQLWLASLEDRYNATDIKALKKRMRRIPVSLIMAQGAIESSWGTSRFAREGNNLFGIRTWGEEGLTPEDIGENSTYLVASYDSLLDSVKAYLLTLNSHRLYGTFRDLRLSSQDPVILSKGLIYYSEKRKEYVSQVNRIIKYNSLKKFDTIRMQQDNSATDPILLSKY